jgi:FAD/FMN-containing dehydrogenase
MRLPILGYMTAAHGIIPQAAVEKLAERVSGSVLVPGDADYDAERGGFQLYGQHTPLAVVCAASAADVREAVEFASAHALPVAVQGTGHGPAFPALEGVLIGTRRMNNVVIDDIARSARISAGARWKEVIEAAARHGLAPLSGAAPHVGATGYTLGGGLGLLARRYGYAADHVRSLEVVTADGRLRRVAADREPDLFWALRGGRDNFGIVTTMEVDLFPVTSLYGGGLYFPEDRAERVAVGYLDWTRAVPDEMTSSIAAVPFPDVQAVPEPLRGRHVLHVRIAYLGTARSGEQLLRPLRALGTPLMDTIRELPYTESGTIHSDPQAPMPYLGNNAVVTSLDETALCALLALVGPGSANPCVLEVRHLGGELASRPKDGNAVGHRQAQYLVALQSRLGGDAPAALRDLHDRALRPLAPVTAGKNLNFVFGANLSADDVRAGYDADAYQRLRQIKVHFDPANMFRLNFNIAPAVSDNAKGVR